MKLINTRAAGQKFKLSGGQILVCDKSGCVETEDEDVIKSLKASGFLSQDEIDIPEAVDFDGSSVESVDEVDEEMTEEEDDGEEDEEIDPLSDFSARDAVVMVKECDDVDVLKAWQEEEQENKGRATVLSAIEERINELG